MPTFFVKISGCIVVFAIISRVIERLSQSSGGHDWRQILERSGSEGAVVVLFWILSATTTGTDYTTSKLGGASLRQAAKTCQDKYQAGGEDLSDDGI